MNYWLNLFTGTTWEEFQRHGADVSGFRKTRRSYLKRVLKGDIFLCYITGVQRWVGALEILGESNNTDKIWGDADFPIRFDVKPLILLKPEHGIPMEQRIDRW